MRNIKLFIIISISILFYSCGSSSSSSSYEDDGYRDKYYEKESAEEGESYMYELNCLIGDCKNGSGTWSGEYYIYKGDFQNGLRHGRGNCLWLYNERKYDGEWKDDQMSGEGVEESYGDKYVGSFIDGKKNGKGTLTLKNGNKYKGEWKDNKKYGKGTYTWKNSGNKYVGMWKNNRQHGKGTSYINFNYNKSFRKKLEKYGSGYDRIRKRIWENGIETNKNW